MAYFAFQDEQKDVTEATADLMMAVLEGIHTGAAVVAVDPGRVGRTVWM